MSRGFVKEEDQEEPIFVPPRAALPPGETNYVTPTGLRLLEKEKSDLEAQRLSLDIEDENELRRETALLDGKIALVSDRIHSARVIDPADQPRDEVRFGAVVTYVQGEDTPTKTFQIVGVDEADIKAGKVAFAAPVARALTGARVGEEVTLRLGGEERTLRVVDISYSDPENEGGDN